MGMDAKSRRRSTVVIVLIALAITLAMIAWCFLGTATPVNQAVVHAGDGSVHELSLAQDGCTTVTTDKGTNVVEVRDGRVRVVEADCPNHDCVDQGWIDQAGQQIVCLPHELWVEVVPASGEAGAGAQNGVDAEGAQDDADASSDFDAIGS